MKKVLMLAPLLCLAACEGSIADAVGDAASNAGGFTDGEPIGTSDTNPGEFEGVTLAGPDKVVFTTADDFAIRAEGDDDAIEQLRYKISNGQIKIGRQNGGSSWRGSDKVTIYLSAPSLKLAKIGGSGDMELDSITGEDTELKIGGSGSIKVESVDAKALESKIGGSGSIWLAGTVESIDISIGGSGDIEGKDLTADEIDISIAGSGNVELSSDGKADVRIAGSGDVRIHGDADCKSRATGSGNIICG